MSEISPDNFSPAALRTLRSNHGNSARAAVRAIYGLPPSDNSRWVGTWQRAFKNLDEEPDEDLDESPDEDPRAEITNLKRPEPGWEGRLWDAMCDYQNAATELEIEQYDAHITIETEAPIGIAVTSDAHIGNVGTDHRTLKQVVDAIREIPGLFVVDDGDIIDNFVAMSHETGRYEQIARPRDQKALAKWIYGLWAPHHLANTAGQHEYFEERVSDFDIGAYLSRKGRSVYLGPGGRLNLLVGGQPYRIGMWHKFKGWSKFDNTAAAKNCYDKHGPFDITITGDKHEPAYSECIWQGLMRIFVQAGTLKIRDSYARSLGYETADPRDYLATPLFILWPKQRRMWGTIDFWDGVEYLKTLRGKIQSTGQS